MSTQDIVQKLWNLCNVLRDDGITYHQYVTELTYILFLKMIKETGTEEKLIEAVKADVQKRLNAADGKAGYGLSEEQREKIVGALGKYSWDYLTSLDGLKLKEYYYQLLTELGSAPLPEISAIYFKAVSSIEEPKNLKKIITEINKLDWYDAKQEGLGDLYEGLLRKNADEKKSGAGQYFTPRPLIDVMTELIAPKFGEKCFDPACGTFGFMIAAHRVATEGLNLFTLPDTEVTKMQDCYGGVELVPDAYRLALMNAYLHNVPAKNIYCMDSLSQNAKRFKEFDVVLTNPPFGTKKGGERPTRDDIMFRTSNKQLNFLQVIYRSLKADGKARCAVVVPDNVLFIGGDGASVRRELMNFCNLHTILRLPTGIFYAQGVKTNVLFFTRGVTETGNTKEVTFYDMRTNQPRFGKTHTLAYEDFAEFMEGYRDESKRTGERWKTYTREKIAENDDDSLHLGLLQDDSVLEYEDLPDPVESGDEAIAQLEEAIDLLASVVKELKALTNPEA